MSHFTVLVIGDNPEDQLQPYHEYECTGIKDQYVKFVPAEESFEEMHKEFTEHKEDYSTFLRFVEDWYGYHQNDKNVWGRVTNPNAKWDWYQLGGCWNGFFKLKEVKKLISRLPDDSVICGFSSSELENLMKLSKKNPLLFISVTNKYGDNSVAVRKEVEQLSNDIQYQAGDLGNPSLLMDNFEAERGTADQAIKRNIDFEAMEKETSDNAKKEWDKVNEAWLGLPEARTWEQVREIDYKDDIDTAREVYHAQPRVKAFKDATESFFADMEPYLLSRDEYVQREINESFQTYAVVKDSIWYEKGEMGWFGISSNEKSEWNGEFKQLINSVADDELLSIYDCHI